MEFGNVDEDAVCEVNCAEPNVSAQETRLETTHVPIERLILYPVWVWNPGVEIHLDTDNDPRRWRWCRLRLGRRDEQQSPVEKDATHRGRREGGPDASSVWMGSPASPQECVKWFGELETTLG